MDLTKPIAELRRQRDKLDEAIHALERLAQSHGSRRGRPPKWLAEARAEDASAPGMAGHDAEPPWP
jgi:hypothetical protein